MPLPLDTDHDRQLIVAFLEEWRQRPAEPNKTRTKHGELKQIGSMLRARHAQFRVGSHFNFNTIRSALETRPEWDQWREELFEERKAKNEHKKQLKAERAEQRAKPLTPDALIIIIIIMPAMNRVTE